MQRGTAAIGGHALLPIIGQAVRRFVEFRNRSCHAAILEKRTRANTSVMPGQRYSPKKWEKRGPDSKYLGVCQLSSLLERKLVASDCPAFAAGSFRSHGRRMSEKYMLGRPWLGREIRETFAG